MRHLVHERIADYYHDVYERVIQALEEAGIRNQVKVMIGGAPVSQGFADEIGADGYSDNANTAVAVAKELIGNKK
jgi:methanogenic corrinoid protein MtbC1